MYNRYSPQPDGSYRKNTFQDNPSVHAPAPNPVAPPPPQPMLPTGVGQSLSGFLGRLLPKDMDTGDLFIILLLLLMAGDNPENKSHSILTIALYFLM